MNGLVVKDVEFNGAVLKAAQDVTNMIWVGVRWVCEGIGLTDGQITNERRKIANDYVLSKGNANLHLPTSSGEQEVLCLQLDYLPLWLAKISITPKMRTESPEVAERLAEYQLKAKDVLAAAFLEKKTVPAVASPKVLQIPLPDNSEEFAELHRKMDQMMNRMTWLEETLATLIRKETKVPTVEEKSEPVLPADRVESCREWKIRMYAMIEEIMSFSPDFKERRDVLRHIYEHMRNTYGIVWEQELKEYSSKYACVNRPKIMDVVFRKPTYRGILESKLTDMVNGLKREEGAEPEKSLYEIISPLGKKRADKSPGFAGTFTMIYHMMRKEYGVDWTKYPEGKKIAISTLPDLKEIFVACVEEKLEAEK